MLSTRTLPARSCTMKMPSVAMTHPSAPSDLYALIFNI